MLFRCTRRNVGNANTACRARPICARAICATQGKGVMPDSTSRFSCAGEPVFHYMGTSTFAIFHPCCRRSRWRKSCSTRLFGKVCYIGCGVTTGIGAVMNTAKAEAGCRAVVFGLGGIGLDVIQGLRLGGAEQIVGVDLNPRRKQIAEKFGTTHFVNPSEVEANSGARSGRSDQRRRGLQASERLDRPTQGDAPGAGMRASRLGQVGDHRGGRRGPGDRDAAVPTGDRAGLDGHRVRRRTRTHRCAADRRLGTWTPGSINIDDLIINAPPFEQINQGFEVSRGVANRSGRW